MLVKAELDEVVNGARGMLSAIDACLERECLVAAVSLIFASIDALAALMRPDPSKNTTRGEFIAWANKYLKPSENLACSAVDLYAARCSVLHTYGTQSDLSRADKARPIVYEWKAGPGADAATPLPDKALVMQVEALNATFRNAVCTFIKDSAIDPAVEARVTENIKTMLCYRPWPQLIAYEAPHSTEKQPQPATT